MLFMLSIVSCCCWAAFRSSVLVSFCLFLSCDPSGLLACVCSFLLVSSTLALRCLFPLLFSMYHLCIILCNHRACISLLLGWIISRHWMCWWVEITAALREEHTYCWYRCVVDCLLAMFVLRSKHGHWLCWMSLPRKNSLTWRQPRQRSNRKQQRATYSK